MAKERRNGSSPFPPDPLPSANGVPPCESTPVPEPKWQIPSKKHRGSHLQLHDERFRETYPALFEWMTVTGLGGSQRQTGSLVLFVEEGRFKACLNDKDTHQVAFISATTFTGLLEAAEEGLVNGDLDWRESKRK